MFNIHKKAGRSKRARETSPRRGAIEHATGGTDPSRVSQSPEPSDRFLVPSQRAETYESRGIREAGDVDSDMGSAKYPRGTLARLGTQILCLLILSLLLLVVAIGVLSWVWFADRNGDLWRRLFLGSGATLLVTVTSVGARFAFASCAYITTAMIACVIVERYGVPAEKISHASIARYTGSILPLAFGGYALKKWFRLLVPLQLVIAITSQFTSTILFSDWGATSLRSFSEDMSVRYDFDQTELDIQSGLDLPPSEDRVKMSQITTPVDPSAFETFAEYAEPSKKVADQRVDDTGPIWRAFLPLAAEDRAKPISTYTGIARVFDARVICVRPEVEELRMTRPGKGEGGNTYNTPTWTGMASIDASLVPDLLGYEMGPRVEVQFSCPVISRVDPHTRLDTPQNHTDEEPAIRTWVKCQTTPRSGNGDYIPGIPSRIPTLDPMFYNKTVPIDNSDLADNIIGYRLGDTFILMDPGNPERNDFPKDPDDDYAPIELELPILDTNGTGPWTDVKSMLQLGPVNSTSLGNSTTKRAGELPLLLRTTLCFDVMIPDAAPVNYLNLTVSGSAIMQAEPTVRWDPKAREYTTAEARRQLGATAQTHDQAERGVLAISRESLMQAIDDVVRPYPLPTEDDVYTIQHAEDSYSPMSHKNEYNVAFCASCQFEDEEGGSYRRTTLFWESLFSDTIAETDSPARAVQAVNTALARAAYLRWVPAFESKRTVAVSRFENARGPVRTAGFAAVMVLVALQVGLLVVAGLMFRRTRWSSLSNAWQVVAHVSSSPDVADVLARASSMSDKEVKGYVGSEERRRILESDGMGKVPGRYAYSDGTFRRIMKHRT